MTQQILRITENAVFKRRPVLVGHLPEQERFDVPAGKEFEIQSYAYADSFGEFDEHIKFALKDTTIKGFNTWFVFNRFAEVVLDGEVVYPLEEQTAAQILRATKDTVLKRRPVQSSELTPEELIQVNKDSTYDLHSYAYSDQQGGFNGHIKFAINKPEHYLKGISTWYVYEGHAQVEFDGKVVYPVPTIAVPTPQPTSSPPTYSGRKLTLPGGRGTVFTDQPIIAGSSFNWGEATHDGDRIPQSVEHLNNIIALAKQLERARKQIGKPFRITSWYRPEPWNSRVGGARRSQHLSGKAVDIVVAGFSGRQLGNQFLPWWPGGLGIYPGNRQHILHLDVGPRRKWGF